MFNFNGKSAKDFPWLRVKSITGSILPPLQRRYITVPSKPGAYHAGRDVGIRQERITIKVNGGTMEQLMERRRILAEWLDTEQSAPFFYDHEPHRIYRAVLSGETNLDQILYYGEAELIFEMPDPYAESRDKKTALLQG
ncbi:MAG: phage tail family protein, partial [Limnochordales bacterium]